MFRGQQVAQRRDLARDLRERQPEQPPRTRGREIDLHAALVALVLDVANASPSPATNPPV